METTFKYKNTVITTPNLEKKLKRMKLSLEDIEIIENPPKKEKEVIKIPKLKTLFDPIEKKYYQFAEDVNIEKELKKLIWNPITKTGVRGIDKKLINRLIHHEGNIK